MRVNNDKKNNYSDRLKELEAQKKQLTLINERIAETKKKREKKKAKKTEGKAVLVTNATSKQDIRRLRQTLNQKIGEVMRSEDSPKLKQATIQILQQKIDSLGRILSQIEQEERERVREAREKRKKSKESVYLTADDLSVEKGSGSNAGSGAGGGVSDVSAELSITSPEGMAATPTVVEASAPADVASIDVLM